MHYSCSQCSEILELSPQSKGFGRFKITCFLCGGKAAFLPKGAPAHAHIHHAPENHTAPVHESSVSSPSASLDNLTLPVEANPDLLALDAMDGAKTLHFQRAQDPTPEPATVLLASSELFIDGVDEGEISTRALPSVSKPYNPTPIPSATKVSRTAARVQEALQSSSSLKQPMPRAQETVLDTPAPDLTPKASSPQHRVTLIILGVIAFLFLGFVLWLVAFGGLALIERALAQ